MPRGWLPIGAAPNYDQTIEPIELGIAGLTHIERIGAGGNAVVYRARQADLDRMVVVKVLTNLDAETTRRRFNRERRAMGRLSQARGIAPLYGSGFTPGGQPYLLMPFYEQGSLQERIAGGKPLAPDQVRDIGVTVATAVQTAHENGVLHRDLKPANILLTRSGSADVADFGIAHLVDDALGTSQALTMTPLYTAPEVFHGVEPGALGDVYSLGATLFALLQGYPAYGDPNGATSVLSLVQRINEEPLPTLPASVPPGLAAVVARAMHKDPAGRPASAGELAAELRAADMTLPSPPRRQRSRRLMAAAVALVLAGLGGAALAVYVLRGDESGQDDTAQPEVIATVTPLPSVTALPLPESTPAPTATAEPFNQASAADAAAQALVRVEAYSCAGVEVATGVVLDDDVVVTSRDVLSSPWFIDVSSRGQITHAQPVASETARGLGLIELTDGAALDALPVVSVADGEQIALVGIDGRAVVATIEAPADAAANLQAVVLEPRAGNPVEPLDVVVTESGAMVGIAEVAAGSIEVLAVDAIRTGDLVQPDYDCPAAFNRDLSAFDTESVVSPAIGELLTMQQLSNAYASEQWAQVRRLEPAKRVYTDQQFVAGWRPLRQGFIYPVDREIDSDGLARWRIGLIGYETWAGNDLTTLFCLTWTVNPTSGAVVQTNQDNVLIYGSQVGQQQRVGFAQPSELRPLIADNC